MKGLVAGIGSIATTRSHRREYEYAFAGFQPDIGTYLSGDPQNMLNNVYSETRDATAGKRILALHVNLGVRGASKLPVSAMARGAVLCAIVDRLEAADFRIEIKGVFGKEIMMGLQSKFPQNSEFYITLKRAQDSLEMERLAFAFGRPAMHRRIGFACQECYGYDSKNGHGVSIAVSDKGDLYVPSINEIDLCAPEQWTSFMLGKLKEQGINLEDS